MKRFRLFIENFLVYGLGGIISGIIPLIMIPIITWIMPSTDYFGISDMSNTIMTFAINFAIFGMYDAMYRVFFDREDEVFKRKVCSTTMTFNVSSSLIVALIMLLFRKQLAEFFLTSEKYDYIICITAFAVFVGATNSIVTAPTRMQNKRKVFLITNAIGPFVSYGLAIVLLIKGYFLIAMPLAGLLSKIIMEIVFWLLNKKWFDYRLFDKKLLKELLAIGIPLLPNFLIYWIFNSCDRIMITRLIGIGASGVYSVGSKLGLASQLIYTAFAGGWQYFAFYTMNDDKQVENNSKIFEYLGVISFACTFLICVFAESIYKLLFKEEYHYAFIVAPYLFMAPLIQMLYQVAGNQFLIIKKTWPTMLILASGAMVNVGINYFFIPVLGIEGAAIATLVGYVISTVLCVIVLYKMQLIVLSKNFYVAVIITIVFMILWRFVFIHKFIHTFVLAIVATGLLLVLYKNAIIKLLQMLKTRKV